MYWILIALAAILIMQKAALLNKIKTAAARYGVDWQLVVAIAWRESSLDPSAIGDNGRSIGLMQVKIATAEWINQGRPVTQNQLLDPEFNLDVAVRYLKYQIDRYHGNIRDAVAAYNHGSHHENLSGVDVNKAYVDGVMNVYDAIKAILS